MIELLIILLIFSVLTNGGLTFNLMLRGAQVKELEERGPEKIVKEIEVIKKATCECSHVSSMHNDEHGCMEILFKTADGIETNKTFRCKCERYTGPQPLPAFYAPPLLDYNGPSDRILS